MNKILFALLTLFYFSISESKTSWIGEWLALDEWQSEFSIIIKNDGSASSNYGNGENGNWKIVDGNLEIVWDSGITDYIFNGVMGIQRLRKTKNKSYTSGMKKLFD
tara:strand:+ start:706 stop:1023 length:318 start_codon:yes stop_codon:yes gene_type:complete